MGGYHFDEEVAADRSIQRAIQGLNEAGWVISGYVRGIKVPYSVQITNFLPAADTDGEKALIIPMPTKHWKETAAFQGVDEGGEKAIKRTRLFQDFFKPDCSPDFSNYRPTNQSTN
jgi:hypothetical protein